MSVDVEEVFIKSDNIEWEIADEGVRRKVLGYNDDLMLVHVEFEKEAVGQRHSHHHTQVSYVISGKFEVEIEGNKEVLTKGDSFFVPPHAKHGAVALEEGELIDVFTPKRDGFVE